MPIRLRSEGIQAADQLGQQKAMSENKWGVKASTDHLDSFPRLRIGEMARLNFTIHLSPGAVVKKFLMDCRLDKNSPVYAANELPADFQHRIEASYEAFKKTPFGIPGLTLITVNSGPIPPN